MIRCDIFKIQIKIKMLLNSCVVYFDRELYFLLMNNKLVG